MTVSFVREDDFATHVVCITALSTLSSLGKNVRQMKHTFRFQDRGFQVFPQSVNTSTFDFAKKTGIDYLGYSSLQQKIQLKKAILASSHASPLVSKYLSTLILFWCYLPVQKSRDWFHRIILYCNKNSSEKSTYLFASSHASLIACCTWSRQKISLRTTA